LSDTEVSRRPALRRYIGKSVAAGIRPEAMALGAVSDGIEGKVVVAETLGSEVLASLEIDAVPVARGEILEELDDEADLAHQHLGATVVARLPADASLRREQRVRLVVEPQKVHFFDLDTGRALGGLSPARDPT
jgi:multiple sugar transport system ATP-binding protein